MKLYGTVSSERATKGQGGNVVLSYTLKIGSATESREVVNIRAKVYTDEHGDECFAVYGTWNGATESEKILKTGYLKEKGERQKGE